MNKKTLAKPQPRRLPTSEQIDAYVNKGSGKDTDIQNTAYTESRLSVSNDVARLTVDLSKKTHRRFKIACAVAGTQMNSEIRQFIERRSRELEASAGME